MKTEAETGGGGDGVNKPRDTWSPKSWGRQEGPPLELSEGARAWLCAVKGPLGWYGRAALGGCGSPPGVWSLDPPSRPSWLSAP